MLFPDESAPPVNISRAWACDVPRNSIVTCVKSSSREWNVLSVCASSMEYSAMNSPSVVVCAAGVVGASGKVMVGLVVEGVGNSKVDADNSSSGLRGGMGSCRHMSVGRCGSNRSSSNMFIDSSSSSSSNRISSNTFGNSSSYYSLTGGDSNGKHRP